VTAAGKSRTHLSGFGTIGAKCLPRVHESATNISIQGITGLKRRLSLSPPTATTPGYPIWGTTELR
jgi:hypothetical protein